MRSHSRQFAAVLAAGLVAAWCVLQLVLTNRIAASYRGHVFPPISGLQLAAPSLVAMAALTVLAAALVVGGRGGWAYLIAAMPAAYLAGWFWDGEPLGIGWAQNSPDIRTWLAVGTAVDTLVAVAVVTALRLALRPRRATMPVRVAGARAIPVLVVLVGWWLTHRPYGDADDRVWIVQAAAAVLAVALLAGSGLPRWARAVTIALLPVLAYPVTADSVIHQIDGMQIVHHVLFLAATATYVAGVPWLLARVRQRRIPLAVGS